MDCSRSSNPLLCLPATIRRQIYLGAGVIIGKRINLATKSDSCPWCIRIFGFYNLLYVCRNMYFDVSRIVYAENSFVVQHEDPRMSLDALRRLTKVSISALTALTFYLNSTPCCFQRCSICSIRCCAGSMDAYSIRCPHRGHKKLLTESSSIDQAVLREWPQTMKHVASNTAPSTLELYVVSDVYDHDMALQIVDPIQCFSNLKKCVIRLGHDPDPFLKKLAENTALRAIGHQTIGPGLPFRFMDMPREIRIQILQYTDLVAPMKEVMWNPKDGYSIRYCISEYPDEVEGLFAHNPALLHSFKFRNCWRKNQGVGCFCRRFHAVSPSGCGCWSTPTSLFLVCQDTLDDARMVFFSQNRFVITSSKGPDVVSEDTPERLEASIFLKDTVPFSSLHWLRSIELVFPPFEEDYLRTTDPAYKDWLQAVSHVVEQLSIPMLDLHVHMADPKTDDGQIVEGAVYRPNLHKGRSLKICGMYMRTLRTFPPLDQFKSFTMHLAVPWGWNSTGHHKSACDSEWYRHFEKERMRIQRTIGRTLVGEYTDRLLEDSNTRNDSQWLEARWTLDEQLLC